MAKLTLSTDSIGIHARTMRPIHCAVVVMALALCSSAHAHEGHEVTGLLSGLVHLLTEIDHVLALFAIGLAVMLVKKAAVRRTLSLTSVARRWFVCGRLTGAAGSSAAGQRCKAAD